MKNICRGLLPTLLVLGFALFTVGPLPASDHFQPEPSIREFVEVTGDSRRHFIWSLQETEGWLLTSRQGRELHTTHLDKNLRTERWSLEKLDGNIRVTAWREGETLHVRGTFRGQSYQAIHAVGELPWYQALSLSLRRHLEDPAEGQDFWTLRPDNLDLHRLQITQIAPTSLPNSDAEVPAYRIEIRPAGWKAAFWKGDYWFHRESREFLRYQGASGPPGWPATIIEPTRQASDK